MSRRCEDWLASLLEYVEDTEAPRKFWTWGGISTICSALQRKVRIPFGLEYLYPNIYVMLVAPPGDCRKGGPLKLSQDFLEDVGVGMFADSPTKRAFTKALAKVRERQHFVRPNESPPVPIYHSSMSIISKEMASLLAVSPKEMIDCLTDLWDSHDKWRYETSGEGKDILHNICINAFIATTPDWIVDNLPESAIGGGFTTRIIIVTGKEKYKWVALPPTPDKKYYQQLLTDLKQISNMVGDFTWSPDALEFYKDWYGSFPEKRKQLHDRRLIGNFSRLHTNAIKVAMALHVAHSDTLILDERDISRAAKLMENSIATASDAFGGFGRSRSSADVEKVMRQLAYQPDTTFAELLQMNFRDTNKEELEGVLRTIEGMGGCTIEKAVDNYGRETFHRVQRKNIAKAMGATHGGEHRQKKEELN